MSAAQNTPPESAPESVPDSIDVTISRPTPRGAFLRSLVLPGWGQAASGSYSRAVFYAISEVASGTMIYKSHAFLTSARASVVLHEADARRRAGLSGVVDPDSIAVFLDADAAVVGARALTESRTQQREDWIAFALFMLFLGGADAFVSAHLSDFPEPLTVNPVPTNSGPPAVEVGIRLPAPWGGPNRR